MIMWSIQILLAVACGAAGTMKLVRSKAQLVANPHMGWIQSVPEARIKRLGVAEVLGAIGLVAPTHVIRREPAAVPTVFALLAIVVALVR